MAKDSINDDLQEAITRFRVAEEQLTELWTSTQKLSSAKRSLDKASTEISKFTDELHTSTKEIIEGLETIREINPQEMYKEINILKSNQQELSSRIRKWTISCAALSITVIVALVIVITLF